jgi:hypothetical protein
MNEELNVPEPENPDGYWITWERMEIDGKKGKAKIKVWHSPVDNKEHRKVIAFDEDR